jgi:N-acetylglutamate synthase-like GNAT family acetyltransferase
MIIEISTPSKEHYKEVVRLAKSFDLDREEMKREDFLVALSNDTVLGFGRLRTYSDCVELATIGVVEALRNYGIGTAIVKKLIENGPKEIYVTNVIPSYFKRFGFKRVKEFPDVLMDKINFCHSFGYDEDQIHVMKLRK